MSAVLESTDAKNKLEDLSGIVIEPGGNPYDALIAACSNDPVSRTLGSRGPQFIHGLDIYMPHFSGYRITSLCEGYWIIIMSLFTQH